MRTSDFTTPLLFEPHYMERVWGGDRLATVLGRTLPEGGPIGESWELVDRPEAVSVVAYGPAAGMTLSELWDGYRVQVFGAESLNWGRGRFPLLIKVLDCTDDLSLQVHPPASVAEELGGEPKTEMWYVAGAEPNSRLIAGVKSGVTEASFRQALGDGSVAACAHEIAVEEGDSLFVPSGRLHALGAGMLVYEIQQSSDTTYRVFDWNRLGLDGQPRPLHVEESMRCIDFTDVEPSLSHGAVGEELASCEFFTVKRANQGLPRMILALKETLWNGVTVSPGRVAVLPAILPASQPEGEWLEITLPEVVRG